VPTKDAHLKQVAHNLTFFQSFDKNTFPDWAVTILFYSALHYVDAFLATHEIDPGSHVERDKMLRTVSQLRPLYNDYCFLKNQSHNARYSPPTPFTPDIIHQLEHTHLSNIKRTLQAFLS
jgi:uncharacterized protein (UPF0332 family)